MSLSAQPTGAVVVTAVSDTAAVTADGPLTFTAADWDTPQTLTVTGTADSDHADETAVVAFTAAGGGYDTATSC